MKSISKKILVNDVTYYKYLGDTGTGDSYGEAQELTYVAMQDRLTRQGTGSGYIVIGNELLIIDAKHSLLDEFSISSDDLVNKSKVTFRDKDYFVVDITRLDYKRGKGIHHWELVLK